MNKRDLVLSLLDESQPQHYIPAAFFLHFDPMYHRGRAAIEKHLEFFKYTEMDFVKIQYEHAFPRMPNLREPEDWSKFPRLGEDFFEEPLRVVEGLVKEAKHEALVIVTLYSPFMVAGQVNGQETITRHLLENPQKAKVGIEIAAEAMLTFVKGCVRAGVDGFYTSTQGAETFRFPTPEPFLEGIKPYDLYIMEEVNRSCPFNILHICDYHGGYNDLSLFLDYPGQIVNCSLRLGDQEISGKDVSKLFSRPFMGGMDRKGIIATGSTYEVKEATLSVLNQAPDRFILAADCTVSSTTPWDNLRTAIRTAHDYIRQK